MPGNPNGAEASQGDRVCRQVSRSTLGTQDVMCVGECGKQNSRPVEGARGETQMNRRRGLLLTPLALAAVVGWGAAAQAAPPGQPLDPAGSAQSAGRKSDSGYWNEHFQGTGNVTQTRCQGMSRGANCITAASRKDAARRAAAARAAAQEASSAPASVNAGQGGN